MKKDIIAIIAIILVLVFTFYIVIKENNVSGEIAAQNSEPSRDSTIFRYKDIIVTFLLPYIREEINSFYNQDYSVSPKFINIIGAERIKGFKTYDFRIVVEILSYTGENTIVGLDHITIKLTENAEVIVEKFEHIRDIPIRPIQVFSHYSI